jgi:rubredoxin
MEKNHAVPNDSPISNAAPFRIWQCILCGFIYEEALGIPEEGIAAGTRWEDVPEQWICPDCSATKTDFEMIEV